MIDTKAVKVPLWVARLLVIISFVPVLAWTVVSRLIRELRSIPQYIWWDCCGEVDSLARLWRTGELRTAEEEW